MKRAQVLAVFALVGGYGVGVLQTAPRWLGWWCIGMALAGAAIVIVGNWWIDRWHARRMAALRAEQATPEAIGRAVYASIGKPLVVTAELDPAGREALMRIAASKGIGLQGVFNAMLNEYVRRHAK